jgi:pyocin large subunit-like protein
MLLIAMDLINLVRQTVHKPNKTNENLYWKVPEGERTALLRILSSGAWHGQFREWVPGALGLYPNDFSYLRVL